jgi:hypothetical protein
MSPKKKGSQAPPKSSKRERVGRKEPSPAKDTATLPPPAPPKQSPRSQHEAATQSLAAILGAMPRNYRDSASPLSNMISQEQVFACCKIWKGLLAVDLKAIKRAAGVTAAQALATLGAMLNNRHFVRNLINSNPVTKDEPEQLENQHMQCGQPTEQQSPTATSHLAGEPVAGGA